MAPPKEPVLSRRPRHRAPDPASSGARGSGATRRALSPANRSRLVLLLALVCGALLVAAPLAILFTGGGPEAGPVREPEGGVFIGGENPGTGSGGNGSGAGGGPSLTTESAQLPAQPVTGQEAVAGDPATAGAGGAPVVVGGSGAAVPAGSAAGFPAGGGGTAPGSTGTPGGGGSQPAQQPGQQPGRQPAPQQPAPPQTAPQKPAPQLPAPQLPVPQKPAPQPSPAPCLCETVKDTVDKVGDTLAPVTGALPLPGLP